MCAGQHNRLAAVLDQVGQRRSGISHGIGAVRDDKAVIVIVPPDDFVRDADPMFRHDIRAVQFKQLHRVRIAHTRHVRDKTEQLLRSQCRGECALGQFRSDGAAGADKQELFSGCI